MRKMKNPREINPLTPYEAMPEFLTPEEYAAAARIGMTKAYELLRDNRIPSLRVGRAYRIPKTVLQIQA